MSTSRNASLIIIALFVLVVTVIPSQGYIVDPSNEVPDRTYWPTEEWRNTTPEQQGMDSSILNRIDEDITDGNIEV
ncbi:MAG: hypothetical protein ACW99G_04535, partial [Candidatus Thorarchaeota archaeon]